VQIMLNDQTFSRGAAWNVGDVRLRSAVPGEGEMGPYREGQTFSYAGQQFAVMEGSPRKVSLQMKPQGDMRYVLPPPSESCHQVIPSHSQVSHLLSWLSLTGGSLRNLGFER